MARSNRNHAVKICHYLWNQNHLHILIVTNEPKALPAFYGEIMKKITETFKALFGLDYLLLWNKRPSVIALPFINDVIERIVYFYTNPAKDCLVDSIEQYPGCSSWSVFKQNNNSIEHRDSTIVKWYRYSEIKPLLKDKHSINHINIKLFEHINAFTYENLQIETNAWMKIYGISDHRDVSEINQQIIDMIIKKENILKTERISENKQVTGVKKLKYLFPKLTGYKPTKSTRRIFVICRNKNYRLNFIKDYKLFCNNCKKAYHELLKGIQNVSWPPGAFTPWLPIIKNSTFYASLVKAG
jgi:hypothetical protein